MSKSNSNNKKSAKISIESLWLGLRIVAVKIVQRIQGYDNTREIVLERYEAIFYQIPKIASSSIKALLRDELNLSGIGLHATRFPSLDPGKLRSGEYEGFFRFCFVRNPWERIVSCYVNKIPPGKNINPTAKGRVLYYFMGKSRSAGRHPLSKVPILNKHMTFDEFVDAVVDSPDEFADKHFRSQHTFVSDERGDVFVDYVGHLESFEDDFSFVAEKIGLKNRLPDHLRKTKHSPFREYYCKETWEKIARRYAKDIELFGYQSEILKEE